jgi:GxxExxY protein
MTQNGFDSYLHVDLTRKIIGVFRQVHFELGFGFVESIYSAAMACALIDAGLYVEREVPIAVHFRGLRVGSFRADMIVESKVLLELKAAELLDGGVASQVINYLRATDLELALVLHFGRKPRVKRFVYSNDRKFLPPNTV